MSGGLLKFELCCLSLQQEKTEQLLADFNVEVAHIAQLSLFQNYEKCLKNCLHVHNVFNSLEDLWANICHYIEDGTFENEQNRKLCLFCCAISCLQLFVKLNWTGPTTEIDSSIDEKTAHDAQTKAKDLFIKDGYFIYHSVKAPHYLYVAKCIFNILSKDKTFQTAAWWLFRCCCLQSQLIDEMSEILFKETSEVLELARSASFLQVDKNESYFIQMHLEAGLSLLHYYQYKQADKYFEIARQTTGIEFGFTGHLGLRTKFQQKPVSQLQMLVKRTRKTKLQSTVVTKPFDLLPKNLALNDEVLLEKIKFVDENVEENPELSPEEYAMILVACTAMQKTNSSHRLEQEKIEATVEFLLSTRSCWCIHTEALRVRCLNQKDRSRTVERSLTQMDNLVAMASNKQLNIKGLLDLFYCVRPPPIWILEKDLAKLYMSLGAVSSALQIYERLEMWEDAILCLIRTERTNAAMEMVDAQLNTKETPNLWCLLGDILQEPKHYQRAWDLSNQRHARSMKSLGYYYVSIKDYSNAIDCLQKSLNILSLQIDTWFTMGCTLLANEDYVKAAKAFRRCVNLDWDNYEAWANLSAAYVKCGKKEQAFKSLSEAIKCNFDKWQLWENYVAVTADVGQFSETVSAYNRLLDLKNKYIDKPVLSILVKAVTKNLLDGNGNRASLLNDKVIQLFGRLTTKVTNDADIWILYAQLYGNGLEDDMARNEKAIQHLHKALRSGVRKAGWEKDETFIAKLIATSSKLSSACSNCKTQTSTTNLSSIRLSVNDFFAKLKQREKTIFDIDAQQIFKDYINDVSDYSENIKQIIELRKSSEKVF